MELTREDLEKMVEICSKWPEELYLTVPQKPNINDILYNMVQSGELTLSEFLEKLQELEEIQNK